MAKVLLATEDRRLADEIGGILVELGHTFVVAAPSDGDIPEKLSGVEAVIADGAVPPGLETGGVPVLFLDESRPELPRKNGTDAYHLSRPPDRRELHFKLECALRHVQPTFSDEARDEEWFRTLFEYAPDAYYICDLAGTFIDGNRAAEEITGYKRQELIGKSFFQVKLLPAKALPVVARLLQESSQGRRTGPDELNLVTKTGGEIPVEISSYPIIMGGRHLVLGIARDISARKKAEEMLQTSEESFRSMFELSPESITLLDRTGKIITTNSRIFDWLGYRPEEIVGRNLAELPILSKVGLFRVLRQFRRRIRGQDVPPYEAEFLTRDGRPVYGRITASPIRNGAGEVTSVLVMISDVTRERRAEEELRTSHDLLDRIFGGMRDAVAVIGPDYRLLKVNDSFLATYGTTRKEVLGNRAKRAMPLAKPCYEATHHRGEPCPEGCHLKRVFATRRPRTYKHVHLNTGGEERTCEISLFPLKNAQGKVESVVAMEHDVTGEMRHAEAQRAARDRAQTYLDIAGVIILALDAKGRVTLVNQKGCELLGRPEKDILGKNFHDSFIPQWSRERIEYTFNRLMAGETEPLKYVESYILNADGRMRLVAWNNTVFTEADGNIVGTLSSGEDITERRQAETALRESEKRFRDFFDNAPEYCYMVSPEGAVLDVNRAALKALGCEKKELVGAPLVRIYAPEYHDKMERLFARWKETGTIENEEMVIRTKGGEKRHVLLSATTVLGRDGEPLHSISIQRDITDRRRTEESLRESEEKYRQLVERANDAIVIIQDERFRYVNPRMAELLGYSEKDLLNARFTDFLEPGEKKEVFARYRSRMAGEDAPSTYETQLLHKSGRRVRVEVNAGVIAYGGRPADLVFLRDITDRKAAEDALRESEAKLKATLDALPDILFEVDRRGRIYDFRAPDAQALYAPPEAFLGKKVDEVVPPEAARVIIAAIAQAAETGSHRGAVYALDLPDGHRWFELSIAAKGDPKSPEGRLIVTARDISERVRAEELIRYQASLVANVNDAIISTDADFHIRSWNAAAERTYGWTREEVLGKPLEEIAPIEFLDQSTEELLREFLEKGMWKGELVHRHKDGSPLSILTSVAPVRDEAGVPIGAVAINRDITELKKAELERDRNRAEIEAIFNNTEVLLWSVRENGGGRLYYDRVNRPFAQVENRTVGELQGGYLDELLGKNEYESGLKQYRKLQRGETQKRELTVGGDPIGDPIGSGNKRRFEVTLIPITDTMGEVHSYIGSAVDLTERLRAIEALRLSEEKYRFLFESSPNLNLIIATDGTLLDSNIPALTDFGYTREEVQGRNALEFVVPRDQELIAGLLEKSYHGDYTPEIDAGIVARDGSVRTILFARENVVLTEQGEPVAIVVTGIDITERKKAEELTKKALREKEVLLKEIHHRVKNNLQIISSLLSLEAENLSDENVLELIATSQNRIKSMALIHEKLYQSKELSRVDFPGYIKSLMDSLLASYATTARFITPSFDLEPLQVDIDTAIPLALIINELVANALEHAFPDGRRGTITIGLKRAGEKGAVLKITDDGVGIGENIDFKNTKTLGLQLVSMLTQQLGAEIEVLRYGAKRSNAKQNGAKRSNAKQKRGTEFIITFGDKAPREDHEA